jgi:8-oxo-dGTP pyrophosphatase MutT (NUDIX family)
VKTATVTSAGGVVIDDAGRVLMISRRAANGRVQWTLPKGLVEKGERPEDAAEREVREETGVAARIAGQPRTIDYWFVWKPEDTRYHKFVKYFPMRPAGEPDGTPDGEAESIEWVPGDQAVRRASFENERGVLREILVKG